MNCYNSSDPAAVNATIVYDFKVDHEDFWSRNYQDVQSQPLPSCSSTSLPLESQCAVCLDRVVYAVCRELKDGVDLTMEAGERHIKILKSDCPRLLSDDAPQWPLLVAIALLVLVLVILGVCFYRTRCRKPNAQRREETQTRQEAESCPDLQQGTPLTASS